MESLVSADAFGKAEGNIDALDRSRARCIDAPGSKRAGRVRKGSSGTWEASPFQQTDKQVPIR